MWRSVSVLVLLATAACAPVNSTIAQSSAAAQEESDLATLEGTIQWGTCGRTGLKMIHTEAVAASNARAAIQAGNEALFQLARSEIASIAGLCTDEKNNCGSGPAHLGMTAQEAIHTSWCFPDKKDTTETAGHIREQWIYESKGGPVGYLYFDNGRLIGIQEHS